MAQHSTSVKPLAHVYFALGNKEHHESDLEDKDENDLDVVLELQPLEPLPRLVRLLVLPLLLSLLLGVCQFPLPALALPFLTPCQGLRVLPPPALQALLLLSAPGGPR